MQGFNIPFYTRKEADRVPLQPEEMRLFDLLKWIQSVCWIVSILAPVAFGGYSLYATMQPHWKVDITQLRDLEKQIQQHNHTRAVYSEIIDRINHRIRMDLLAAPILSPTPKKIFLDTIQYQSSANMLSSEFSIQGYTTKPDQEMVKNYVSSLEKKLQNALPDFKLNLALTNNSLDPKSGNLKFTISGKIE